MFEQQPATKGTRRMLDHVLDQLRNRDVGMQALAEDRPDPSTMLNGWIFESLGEGR
jgi:hypothetical protein